MTDILTHLPQLLFSAFAFILTISFLVAIHEYGHFWMARRFGVRIEKFSIGFGKPIVKWHGKRDNTEYSFSWIPLGGYVKMYGENPADSDEKQERVVDLSGDFATDNSTSGSFSALPPFKRLLIAFAGPAVNLIFAVFALWLLFIIGVPALKPTIGSVSSESALSTANIGNGDNIISVNGSSVDTLSDATIYLVDALGNANVPLVAVDNNGQSKTVKLDLTAYQAGNEMAVEQLVGFKWAIAEVGDNQPVKIDTVGVGSPAAKAAIKSGDHIVSVNEQPISGWQDFVNVVQSNPDVPLTIAILRDEKPQTLTLTPGKHPSNAKLGYAGVSPQIDRSIYDQYRTTKRYDWLTALPKAIVANYKQGELMLKTLWRLAAGKASVENLGGPLTIADYSGKTLEAGYVTYFQFLASISLILAVMNLLPIPVLDGGHIVMCVVEMIRGKPLSDRALDILMRLGGSVLLTFMLFVITLDIWRYVFK